jgi:hypothetical protein
MISEIERIDILQSQYEEEGYLYLPDLLSSSLINRLTNLLYTEFDTQSTAFQQETGARLEDAAGVRAFLDSQPDYEAWFASLGRDMQHLIKGEFPLAVRLRDEFRQLGQQYELADLLRTLLGGSGLRFHYPPMLRFKVPGMSQAQVPLHQDAPYFPHLATFANVWIPLCAITEECGGVNVLAGSHKLGVLEHQQSTLWGAYVARERIDSARYPDRHILMKPGDVLIFGPNLLHYTHSNTSSQVRCSIDSRWFNGDTETTRQYYDLDAQEVVKLF